MMAPPPRGNPQISDAPSSWILQGLKHPNDDTNPCIIDQQVNNQDLIEPSSKKTF